MNKPIKRCWKGPTTQGWNLINGEGPIWHPIPMSAFLLLTQEASIIWWWWMIYCRQSMAITATIRKSMCWHVLNQCELSLLLITGGIQIYKTISRQPLSTWKTGRLFGKIITRILTFIWYWIGIISIKLLRVKKTASTTPCPSHSMLVSRFMKIRL